MLFYGAETWSVTQQDIGRIPGEMPLGHCYSVEYAVQCRHTGGDWRAANQRATETEESPGSDGCHQQRPN